MNSDNITKEQLCKMFDHTLLKAFANMEDLKKLCLEAIQYNFGMVAINSYPVKFCKNILKETDIHVGAAISFPLGQTTIDTKLFEIERAAKDGADEIDYVINIAEVKNKNYDYIKLEMEKIVLLCKEYNLLSKVIFENCYLEKEEIVKVANIAKEIKPDFIKTSTGFGTSGALLEDIKLMKYTVGDTVKVKASGGIASWDVCKKMIDVGVERIGTSNSIKILNEFLETKNIF